MTLHTQPSCINYLSELNTFGPWLSHQGPEKAALPCTARACGFPEAVCSCLSSSLSVDLQNSAPCCDTAAETVLQREGYPPDTFWMMLLNSKVKQGTAEMHAQSTGTGCWGSIHAVGSESRSAKILQSLLQQCIDWDRVPRARAFPEEADLAHKTPGLW